MSSFWRAVDGSLGTVAGARNFPLLFRNFEFRLPLRCRGIYLGSGAK